MFLGGLNALHARFRTMARLRLVLLGYATAAAVILSAPRPGAAEDDLATGLQLFEAGRYGEARDVLSGVKDPSGEALYYLGVAAARSGDDATAVDALDRALDAGAALPGTHLELGMAYYRLNRFDQASQSLDIHLAKNPRDAAALLFRGLAERSLDGHTTAIPYFEKAAEIDAEFRQLGLYNAGVSRLRTGDLTGARKALEAALEAGQDDEIAAGIRLELRKIEKREAAKAWKATVRYGLRFDDAVTTEETDTSSGKADHAQVIEVEIGFKILEDAPFDLEAGYDFSQTLHNRQGAFDIQDHLLSLSAEKEVAGFDTGLTAQYSRTFLGGEDFMGTASVTPSVGYSLRDGWYINGSYSYLNKNFTHNDDRDAEQHALGIDNFFFPFEDVRRYLSLSYRIEREDTRDREYEYLGHSLTAGFNTPLPNPGTILRDNPVANVSYSFSIEDYDHVTESIGKRRGDKSKTVALELTVPIVEHVDGVIDYEYIDAISNLDSSDYEENIVTGSLQLQF